MPRWGVWLGRTLPRGTCAEAASIPFYQRPAAAEGLPLPSSLPELWVVDDSYRVRLRLEVAGNGDWARIAIEIDRWLQGRGLFEANCGHCHGMDGAQASSAEVKSLVGISSRYPETEVLRLGAQFGGVDMTGWSEAKKRTLLAYIRGL
ncbi:MAG: c-type cytochrome [Bryobacterales bacterium]|nr:c-type cytochrome [Bryobacterales bacterium]